MSRLIDADEAIDYVNNLITVHRFYHPRSTTENFPISEVIAKINEVPTVDAVPVMHGHWEEKEVFYDDNGNGVIAEWQSCRCSDCKKYDTSPYLYYFKEPKYCSECGAKMDEVVE